MRPADEVVRLLPLEALDGGITPGEYCLRHNPDRAARILIVNPRDYIYPRSEGTLSLTQHIFSTPDCVERQTVQIPLSPFGTSGNTVRQKQGKEEEGVWRKR